LHRWSGKRAGNEFLFQMRNEYWSAECIAKKIVTACPHCLILFKNEYPELGVE
jgi:Fe-S oxidoreductase